MQFTFSLEFYRSFKDWNYYDQLIMNKIFEELVEGMKKLEHQGT